MKVSFIVPCRNKERHVAATVRSVLAQTYSPMEIVLSSQGSTDGTLAVLRDLSRGYDGPNRVRLLHCPDVDYRGMPGLNAHLNWLDGRIEGDVVIMCSADDLNHPDRAKHTVRAFEEHNPSYVNTTVQYMNPDGSDPGFTTFPDKATRWLTPVETIRHQIGSCGSSAWARDLYQKHGPLVGVEQQDMILPMMALMERGIYYVDLPLHTYVQHADPNNTGFGGKIKAGVEGTAEHAQIVELNNFLNVRNWTSILRRWQQNGWLDKVREDLAVYDALMEKICLTAEAAANVREVLVMSRIPPMVMDV